MFTPTVPTLKQGATDLGGNPLFNLRWGPNPTDTYDDAGAFLKLLEGKTGLAPVYNLSYANGAIGAPVPYATLEAAAAAQNNGTFIFNFVSGSFAAPVNLANTFIIGNGAQLGGPSLVSTYPQFTDLNLFFYNGLTLSTRGVLLNCTITGPVTLTTDGAAGETVLTLSNTVIEGDVNGAGNMTLKLVNGSEVRGAVAANIKIVSVSANGIYRGAVANNTSYQIRDTATAPDGSLVAAKATFTTGAAYNAAQWNVVVVGANAASVRTQISALAGNWLTYDNTTGVFSVPFTPENPANKAADLTAPGPVTYPSTQAAAAAIAAAEARAKAYADTTAASSLNYGGTYSASGNPGFPTTGTGSGGGIRRGDQYTVVGANADGTSTIGGVRVDNGDVFTAAQASPGQVAANWNFLQANVFQATETVAGTTRVAAQPFVQDEATANDTDTVTPRKFWLGVARLLGKANTWALRQTFTAAPRFSSVAAGSLLKVDANGELAAATAADLSAAGGSTTAPFAAQATDIVVTHGKGRLMTVQVWTNTNDLWNVPITQATDLNSFTVYGVKNTAVKITYN